MENYNTSIEEDNFDIAVVGMSGRFPGAKGIDEFWKNLCAGIESVTFFSDEELIESGIDASDLNEPNYIKASPILEGPDLFDASFFGFSPKEAKMMDPQHRIILECAWEALENAGYDTDRYEGSIGMYAGASLNTYLLFSGIIPEFHNEYLPMLFGNDKDYLATRVSYKLNLKGPSLAVQSACSTSLVAVHIACQSLLNGESDMALAGGVSVRVPHKTGYFYQEGSIYSPDGHCRAFDAKAKGTIFGSGVGIVVLKRLSDAVADRDNIYAVIKGSAINNDGSSKVDYTAPSVNSQSEAIVEALENSGIEADSIAYIETHGTGTALGDPIEIAALTNAFSAYTDKKGFCAVGSVKTNIGHLDAAAGISGLIKTILALKHKMIPPSLHYEKANPEIDFKNSPFYVNNTLSEWKANTYPRRAGVSSLGVGGTNVHVILEEAPAAEDSGKSRPWQLLLLSAKTNTALDTATLNIAHNLKQNNHLNLSDVAYTLQTGRKVFNHRRMLVCENLQDAVASLETPNATRVLTSFQEAGNRNVVFMFSGQGSQYINMGLELYKTEPCFREEIGRCSEILIPHLSRDLRDILYPDEENAEEAAHSLKQTYITQPALFTIEYSLAKLWMSWGVHPETLVGHSIGEYVAACLAGVFSLEDALSLLAARGRLMQSLPGGSMMAVPLSEKEILPYLGETLSLAVINGPSRCVVSGKEEDINSFAQQLSNNNIDFIKLHTSHAFHSMMMDPILDTFAERVNQVAMSPPKTPFLSNVTGTWITPDESVNPDYWTRHLRQTVRFSDNIKELMKQPDRVLLEIGPGHTLSTLSRMHPDKIKGQIILSSVHHPKDRQSDVAFILNTLGRLWMAGVKIDWQGFYENEIRHRLPLPAYPFERKSYWAASKKQPYTAFTSAGIPEEKEEIPPDASESEQQFSNAHDDAPGNKTEKQVAHIWQELLGVEQIGIHDNFFDLGGSSLIAVSMFTQIEKKFGKKLPISVLFEAPTVEQLAKVISKDECSPSWSSLVPIKPDGSRLPFYCVHGAGGHILEFYPLAQNLDADQPFYGIQAEGLNEKPTGNLTIEEMAANYVKEIRTFQPSGPYVVGGYCFGGFVAFEMARLLKQQGEEVAALVLIESRNAELSSNGSASEPALFSSFFHYLSNKINLEISNLSVLGPKARFSYILQRTERVIEKLRVRTEMIMDPFLTRFHLRNGYSLPYLVEAHRIVNERALQKYMTQISDTGQPYRGKVIIFRAGEQHCGVCADPHLGWGTVLESEPEVYEIPGRHENIIEDPWVQRLVEKMKFSLDRLQVGASV